MSTTVPLFPTDAEDSGPTKPPRRQAPHTFTTCMLDPDILTKGAAARALGIHPKTLDRFYRLRVGPPRLTIGRRVYYRRQLLLSWVLSREEKPPEANGGRRRQKQPPMSGI
jgi:hypothetical protein